MLLTLFVTVALWQPSGATENTRPALPNELATYRTWRPLIKNPYEVPHELFIRCIAPTPQDWDEAEEHYGPHMRKYVQYFGNVDAVEALIAKRPLPVGSVVAKEKFLNRPQGTPDGVAFMIKRDAPQFAASGGWEFLYFSANGEKQLAHDGCVVCHQAAKGTDYVFGKYPRE